jgi:DNA-directed RNA polymerase subunit RPC12/RpoP
MGKRLGRATWSKLCPVCGQFPLYGSAEVYDELQDGDEISCQHCGARMSVHTWTVRHFNMTEIIEDCNDRDHQNIYSGNRRND